MLLTPHNAVAYLLERRLIGADVLDADLTILDASRRNRNLKVLRRDGPCYLLKQGVGPEAVASVAREGAVYELLQSVEANDLARYVPRYYGYDPDRHVLAIELLRGAQDLREYRARHGRFSAGLAATLGNALGTLHRCFGGWRGRAGDEGRVAKATPWILSIHQPGLSIFRDISSANLQLIKIVQRFSEFSEHLDELRQGWRPETLIHNDVKSDNCIVHGRSGRKPGLKLVDWETAGMGDPCWDTGGVFSDYLCLWLMSTPVTGQAPPDRSLELSRYPLERMQPAMCAFWSSYVRRMGLAAATSDRWLLRAVRFAAARLVQTAFEQMQHSWLLADHAVCQLQLSLNILRRPEEAALHLLGMAWQQLEAEQAGAG